MATTEDDQKSKTKLDRSGDQLMTSYKPLSYAAVHQEIETLKDVSAEISREWQEEVSLYEETIRHKFKHVPRRNYRNDENIVTDTKLYPYHTACYPLLDAYDQRMNSQEVPGCLPCSLEAIYKCFIGLPTMPFSISVLQMEDSHALFLEEWMGGLDERLESQKGHNHWPEHEKIYDDSIASCSYGLTKFPTQANNRADILFNLLRHAMSDLQKDHRLASAILARMAKWKLLQSVQYLRKVLSIIVAERKVCNGQCYLDEDVDEPDHDCDQWKFFESIIPGMLSTGIEYFTLAHALTIAGIVQLYFDELNPAAAQLEASTVEEAVNPKLKSLKGGDDKRRTMLKQKLYLSKHTYDDERSESDSDEDDEGISEYEERDWIDEIVLGLGHHAVLSRRRITLCLDRLQNRTSIMCDSDVLALEMEKSINSFYNCGKCLVYIGEASLRRLPNNPRVVGFCSRLVLCLTQLFLEPNLDFYYYSRVYLRAGKSLIDPNRYADSILKATKNYRERHFPATSFLDEKCEYDRVTREVIENSVSFLRAPPHKDIQDLVWCMFTKDFVNTTSSRCGYGDIQTWWEIPVSPLDPLLFFYTCNVPEKELNAAWEIDERGQELWHNELCARYDLSLVLLLCAWQAPWSIERHHSFQKPFRDAVRTLFLCANRIRMPTDIVSQICKYLRRDWWPDDRVQCFSEECLEKQANKMLQQKLIHQITSISPKLKRAPRPFINCPSCSVASYCCNDHRQSDYRDGHKGACGNPPCKVPGQKEIELLNNVLCIQRQESGSPVLNDEVIQLIESMLDTSMDNDDYSDNGSWESVDTDEDEDDDQSESMTNVVHRFFEKECYRALDSNDD